MVFKTCTKCGQERDKLLFHKDKNRRDGLTPWCKDCVKYSGRKWRENNRERDRWSSLDYYYNNKETRLIYQKVSSKKWRLNNPHLNAAKSAAYRARKNNAEPTWITGPQKAHIKRTYDLARTMSEITGEIYHVDHIVPLKGESVCGLHVPWNLQVLPANLNLSKSNKVEE